MLEAVYALVHDISLLEEKCLQRAHLHPYYHLRQTLLDRDRRFRVTCRQMSPAIIPFAVRILLEQH